LSHYAPDLMFVPSPAGFASTLHNTQHLWPQTTFLKSPQQSASIGTPLAPPSVLVASGPTMFSSSPTSIFCLVALSPELCSAQSLLHPQALNKGLSNEPRCNTREVLIVLLCAGLQVCTPFSSFHLGLVQYSTSVTTRYISEISSMIRLN